MARSDDDDVEVVMLRGPGAKKFLASLSPADDDNDDDDGDDEDEPHDRRSTDKKGNGKGTSSGFKYFSRG